MKELKEKKIWTGNYLGITFEIVNWQLEYPDKTEEKWNYYIYIHLNRIPRRYKPSSFWLKRRPAEKENDFYSRVACYDYYSHPILSNIDFHGGITFYSKERGFDNEPKCIKVGCDYSHLYDENMTYSLEYVLVDVKNTISSFRDLVKRYKYVCGGNDKLYDLEDGKLNNEQFYSREWAGDKEWFQKL